MLNYQRMAEVVGNQVKALKLALDRKRDENENLHIALREMQGQSNDQQRLGKLYYRIMLSRWQEAAANKKYELALQDVRQFSGDILDLETALRDKEGELAEVQSEFQEKILSFETMKIEMQARLAGGGAEMHKVEQLVSECLDMKTELEAEHMQTRADLSQALLARDEC